MTKNQQKPIRILHITFDMDCGGTEQVIYQLVTNLDHTAFENEIACIDGEVGATGQDLEAKHGIKVHARKRRPGFDLTTILWLRKLIKECRFDVIHCHQYSPYTYGWFAHWGTGARIVFTEHGRFYPDRHRRKARLLNPLIARTTNVLVAISNATREALAEYEYMPVSRINVIYNGISPLQKDGRAIERLRAQLHIEPEEIVIGTVARLDAVKNQKLILDATRQLVDQGHNIRTLLVGEGPEKENLKTLSEDLNLGDRVIFTGYQPNPADYLALMDIFLLPSHTEGTSMTILESMSLAIPVIATRVGGTPEIIENEKTGLLIEPNSLEELLDSINFLISDLRQRKLLSDNAKLRFKQLFSAEKMVDEYQKIYRRISAHCQPISHKRNAEF